MPNRLKDVSFGTRVDPEGWDEPFDDDGWRGSGKWEWPEQQLRLRHFGPHEFDHPELMDADFLLKLDYLREMCDFALKVKDDGRTEAEHRSLYRREIEDDGHWPSDSSHVRLNGEPVASVDLRPSSPTEGRQMVLLWMILEFERRGVFEHVGLGHYNRHVHIDDQSRLRGRRPAVWVGSSR